PAPDMLAARARVLLDGGQPKRAAALLRRVVSVDLGGPESMLDLGTALAPESGAQEEVVRLRQRALEADPELLQKLRAKGNAALLALDVGEASAAFRRADLLAPDQPYVLSGLATCELFSGEVEEAVAKYGRAVALRP